MLQGPLQHIALGVEDWSSGQHLRTGRMKNSHTANNMPILHQEPEDMSQPVKMPFEPIEWSSACARPSPCTTCLFKSPSDGSQDCPECSSSLAKSLRAVSSPPSTPTSATKQEPRDPAELLGGEAMAKTTSAMSFDSAYGSSMNGSLVSGMVGMGDAFHESPGGYGGYVQTSQMPYGQATSQYGPNEGQFEYNVSMYDEPLDACEAVSPMDQPIYPMPSPLMPYAGSPQLESPVTFIGSQHTTEPPPSPSPTVDMSTLGPRERFKCSESGCGRCFSRQADLQRHYDHVHPGPDAGRKGHACDYPKCARQFAPFRRKDHFRDHLREFHKEDLLRRGGQEPPEWFNDRNINLGVWRCGRCLRRNSLDKRGYTCHKCKVDCEPARVSHRQKQQRRATVQTTTATTAPREVVGGSGVRARSLQAQGPVRVSKKGQPTAARLAPNLARLSPLSTGAALAPAAASWQGPATAPATVAESGGMMLFAPPSPYGGVRTPLNAVFAYSEEQMPLSAL